MEMLMDSMYDHDWIRYIWKNEVYSPSSSLYPPTDTPTPVRRTIHAWT